jgi:hypothetical protein
MVIVSHKEARSRPWQSRVLVAGGKPVAKWRDAARADGRNDAISGDGRETADGFTASQSAAGWSIRGQTIRQTHGNGLR